MTGNDMTVLIVMAAYVIVMLLIGFFFSKRSNASSENYFIGGRKLGPWVTAFSAEASDMSGYLLMGLPGVAYFCGASEAMWTAIGLAIGTYLNWLLVAKRLRKYSERADNSITLPAFFSNRFGDKKHILMTVSALIILVFLAVYVGSCFATCGKLFSTVFGLDYTTMMVVGALAVFVYTIFGGYLSVCTTDLIQGVFMFFAIIVVFVGTLASVGGIDNAVAFLSDIPGFLSATLAANPIVGEDGNQVVENGTALFGEASSYGVVTILSTLSWGLGYFGMPQVLIRFMGIEDPENITKSRRIATVWCVLSLGLAISVGLFGRAMIPTELLTQSAAETIFIVISKMLLPAFLTGLVVAGVLAATMSSSDSYLLIVGSAIAENIFRGLLKRDATDRQVMTVSRCTLVVVALFAMFIARDPNSSIFGIVSYAWAGFGAAFGPIVLLALYWRRANWQGALAGMLTGGGTVVAWNVLDSMFGGLFTQIYELLPAFLLALAVNIIVSKLTAPPSDEVTELFDHYMDDDWQPGTQTAPGKITGSAPEQIVSKIAEPDTKEAALTGVAQTTLQPSDAEDG